MIVLTEWKTQVEQALETFMNRLEAPDRLREAMLYSLDAGGNVSGRH